MHKAANGADRIMCGTDGTEFGVNWTRKAIADSEIGEEAREISSRNASAMLARFEKVRPREKAAA